VDLRFRTEAGYLTGNVTYYRGNSGNVTLPSVSAIVSELSANLKKDPYIPDPEKTQRSSFGEVSYKNEHVSHDQIGINMNEQPSTNTEDEDTKQSYSVDDRVSGDGDEDASSTGAASEYEETDDDSSAETTNQIDELVRQHTNIKVEPVDSAESDHAVASSNRMYLSPRQIRRTKVKPISRAQTEHMCPTCDVGFPSRQLLKKHLLAGHQADSRRPCHICGEKNFFKAKDLFVVHMMSHSNGDLWTCDRCGDGFELKRNMTRHQRLHCKLKCSHVQCGMLFSGKKLLNAHVKTHLGENPWTCETCGKVFKRNR
jgi:rubrerythrin